MDILYLLILLGFISRSVLTEDNLVINPANNTAVKVGAANVSLICSYEHDQPSKRKWYKTAKDDDNELPDGSNVADISDTITISPNPAEDDSSQLKISIVSTDHADKYICHTDNAADTESDNKSAYLEVLTPVCSITSDGAETESLEFSCGATYAGEWEPELEFGDTADNSSSVENDKTVILTGKKAVANVTEGTTWNCKANMKKTNLPNSVTVDSDEDNFEVADICSWILAAPAAEPMVSENIINATEGVVITCSGSNGVPPPTFSWEQDNTTISDRGNLTLTSDQSGQTLTCVARNPYGNQTKGVEVPAFAAVNGTTDIPGITAAPTEEPVTAGVDRVEVLPILLLVNVILATVV